MSGTGAWCPLAPHEELHGRCANSDVVTNHVMGVYEAAEDPGVFVESFALATWAEHEREQHRRTAADSALHAEARKFLVNGEPPMVHHFLAASVRPGQRPQSPPNLDASPVHSHESWAETQPTVRIRDGSIGNFRLVRVRIGHCGSAVSQCGAK
jgi:Transmembrane secretion effector